MIVGRKIDGSAIYKHFYSRISKQDAKEKGKEYIAAKDRRMNCPDDITFEEYAKMYIDTYARNRVKGNTLQSTYITPIYKHLIPEFGKYQLSAIRPLDVQKFLNDRSTTLSKGYLGIIRVRLLEILETAVENNLITKNPVNAHVIAQSTQTPKQKRYYTKEQRELIKNYFMDKPQGFPIIIMLYTGVTCSELLGLQWNDITPPGTISVNKSVVYYKKDDSCIVEIGKTKNKHRVRTIPIPGWLYNLLETRRTNSDYYVTGNDCPQNPQVFRRQYKKLLKQMHKYYEQQGIDIPELNCHELRHTAATLWALSGVDIYAIAKLGGWSNLKMLSEVYGHSSTDSLRKKLGY